MKKLRQEGQTGYKKIQEYTRYLTVLVCILQALMYMRLLIGVGMGSERFIYPGMETQAIIMGVIAMTAGTIFLMWLGEQIDEYGIGNGISLIIMAGIVARMPWAIYQVIKQADFRIGAPAGSIGPAKILFLVVAFVFVVAGAILITQGQRRIPIQQAKQMRGRRMYGGSGHYLPLRVNHGGVMPIIFASSFMMFPPIVGAVAGVGVSPLDRHAENLRRPGRLRLYVQRPVHAADHPLRVLLGHGPVPAAGDGEEPARFGQFHPGSAARPKNGGIPGDGHGADHLLRGRVPGGHRGDSARRRVRAWAFRPASRRFWAARAC